MQVFSKNHKTLSSYLKAVSKWIDTETKKSIPRGNSKDFLYELMHDYPNRGGKKFRPALVFLCCELFGGNPDDALNSAIAIELFHNFALIHDDIEDFSEVRRGEPTLHLKYGTSLAINCGDAIFGLVHETLLKNHLKISNHVGIKIHKLFNKVIRNTFEGQALDIGWIEKQIFPSEKEYLEMIIKKTGFYSGSGPCQCGAIIGGASEQEINSIGIFGESIGIGFQIRDDLLNITEENEFNPPTPGSGGYGKERGGDILEGKRTLITIELLKRLPEKDAKLLNQILLKSREDVTEKDINWVINSVYKTGAIKSVFDYCLNQADLASNVLKKFKHHPAKILLEQLVDYLTLDRKA